MSNMWGKRAISLFTGAKITKKTLTKTQIMKIMIIFAEKLTKS